MEDRQDKRRREASKYLRDTWNLAYAPTTLARLASAGGGPLYYMRGKFALYRVQDLDAFARSKIGGLKRRASGPVEMRVA